VLTLVVGNKNYSSWSLRAWLYLEEAGVPFTELRIPLFQGEDWRERVRAFHPAGRLPALVDGPLEEGVPAEGAVRVWDSGAIIEYVRATRETKCGWPEEPRAMAWAMSLAAEMHGGFLGVRAELPMNVRASKPGRFEQLSAKARLEVERIRAMWGECLAASGGPYLFGEAMTIADVMYAPVASRFRTYAIELAPELEAYVEAIHARPAMKRWVEEAAAEEEHLPFVDALKSDLPPALG